MEERPEDKLECERTSAETGRPTGQVEPLASIADLGLGSGEHGRHSCHRRQTDTTGRQATTSKCKMCFEAQGSGELSYEINYHGSKSGWERNCGGVPAATAAEPVVESRAATRGGSVHVHSMLPGRATVLQPRTGLAN